MAVDGDQGSGYFQLSWAILSTIGLVNFCLGFMVLGITGRCRILAVPMVVSAACAIANGLCVIAFINPFPRGSQLTAVVFCDVFWLIEEAGLTFYGYIILRHVAVIGSYRRMIDTIFWSLITVVVALRAAMLACHIKVSLVDSTTIARAIYRMQTGYFIGITLIEALTAACLLRCFYVAHKGAESAQLRTGLMRHLMRSTEIRVTILCLISITRTITSLFLVPGLSEVAFASQFDRFAVTLEAMFPIVMYIDILGSRIAFSEDARSNSMNTPRSDASDRRPGGSKSRMSSYDTHPQVEAVGTGIHWGPDRPDRRFRRHSSGDNILGVEDVEAKTAEQPTNGAIVAHTTIVRQVHLEDSSTPEGSATP